MTIKRASGLLALTLSVIVSIGLLMPVTVFAEDNPNNDLKISNVQGVDCDLNNIEQKDTITVNVTLENVPVENGQPLDMEDGALHVTIVVDDPNSNNSVIFTGDASGVVFGPDDQTVTVPVTLTQDKAAASANGIWTAKKSGFINAGLTSQYYGFTPVTDPNGYYFYSANVAFAYTAPATPAKKVVKAPKTGEMGLIPGAALLMITMGGAISISGRKKNN